jgi:hypothetical protein
MMDPNDPKSDSRIEKLFSVIVAQAITPSR